MNGSMSDMREFNRETLDQLRDALGGEPSPAFLVASASTYGLPMHSETEC